MDGMPGGTRLSVSTLTRFDHQTPSTLSCRATTDVQPCSTREQAFAPHRPHREHRPTPERQARLARLMRQPTTDVVPLDRVDAATVGRLLNASSADDIVDAHVVVCARCAGQQVVTSDPDDVRRLDPQLTVVEG